MKPEVAKRSVDSLQRIYAIIIALAIGHALILAFTRDGQLIADETLFRYFPQFIAFVVTTVPFFHGMNRHLENCYLDRGSNPIEGALLFDFVVFFIEAMLLFAFAATLVSTDLKCYMVLGILLVFDSIWAFVSHLIHYRAIKGGPLRWCVINAITIGVGVFVYSHTYFSPEAKPWLLTVLVFARAISDYSLCWRFYFPTT